MSKSFFNASASQSSNSELEYKKKKSFGYGYGYYFRPLQDYHGGQFSRLEVEFYEYLVGLADYYLREGNLTFYHSYSKVNEDTRISKETIQTMVTKFKELGLLRTFLGKQYGRNVTNFEVDFLGIIRKRKMLFGNPEFYEPAKAERIIKRLNALVQMHLERKRLLNRRWKPKRY